MAEITNKVVTVPLLQHYKEKEDTANGSKYVAQVVGSQLVETADVTKLKGLENIKEVQVNGQKLTVGDDGIVNIDVEGVITGDNLVSDTELAEQLGQYLKSSDAQSTYVKEADFDSKVDGKIGTLGVIKGSCEKADLESKKEGAKENDVYIVTDDDNHMYFYNGTDFVDTQAKAHVDLSGYVQKDGNKVLVSPTDVTQITTNKTDIATINEKLGKIQEAEEADIDALFAD